MSAPSLARVSTTDGRPIPPAAGSIVDAVDYVAAFVLLRWAMQAVPAACPLLTAAPLSALEVLRCVRHPPCRDRRALVEARAARHAQAAPTGDPVWNGLLIRDARLRAMEAQARHQEMARWLH